MLIVYVFSFSTSSSLRFEYEIKRERFQLPSGRNSRLNRRWKYTERLVCTPREMENSLKTFFWCRSACSGVLSGFQRCQPATWKPWMRCLRDFGVDSAWQMWANFSSTFPGWSCKGIFQLLNSHFLLNPSHGDEHLLVCLPNTQQLIGGEKLHDRVEIKFDGKSSRSHGERLLCWRLFSNAEERKFSRESSLIAL